MSGPFKGVFFDLDGTLADTIDLILRSWRHTMRTHLGESPPDSDFLATIGAPLPVQLRDFARNDEEWSAMRQTYMAFQDEVHDQSVAPFPGALECVDELQAEGVAVAIVTSKTRRIAERTMSVCGLWERIEAVVCGDDVERGKPDPLPVRVALEMTGLSAEPGSVLFVGDAPFDLRAGRAAGTKTAAVSWGPHHVDELRKEGPDYVLTALDRVVPLATSRAGS